jgi:hypothetical protein
MAKWRRPSRPFLSRAQLFHLEDPKAEQRRALPATPHDRPADIRIIDLLFAARDGDFYPLRELIPLMKQHDDDLFWGAASCLLSYGAPASILRELVQSFSAALFVEKDFVVQSWIAETLLTSGLLWTVPEALRIMAAQSDRDEMFSIPARLSFLLEPDPGRIFSGPPKVPEPGVFPDWYERDFIFDDQPYIDAVLAEYALKLDVSSHGDRSAFFFGEEVSIEAIAYSTLQTIADAGDNERTSLIRSILEAYTGFDLVNFYDRNAILDRTGASVALEALFDALDLGAFPPGRRFFFGHLVPD